MKRGLCKKEVVYEFLKAHKDACFSSKELIENRLLDASEAAVYRSLVSLTEEGKILKFTSGKGEEVFYQYNTLSGCHGHFHLKCLQCGEILHVDCSFLAGMARHIRAEHAFTVDNTKTVFYGVCSRCREKGEAK